MIITMLIGFWCCKDHPLTLKTQIHVTKTLSFWIEHAKLSACMRIVAHEIKNIVAYSFA